MRTFALLIFSLVWILPAPATAADVAADGLHADWGTRTYETVTLVFPAETDQMSIEVPIAGQTRKLELTRHSLRAPGLQAHVYLPSGQTVLQPLAAPRTFRGVVAGDSDALVVASFGRYGLTAAIHDDQGTWRVEPTRRYDPAAPAGQHLVFIPGATQFQCGVIGNAAPAGTVQASTAHPFGGVAPTMCGMTRCDIAFDCDFEYFNEQGGTVLLTTDRVEAILNDVDFFYSRDLMVTYQLTGVVVRTAQFYADISGGTLLDDFRAEWNANQGAITRDIGHLMTDKSNLSGYGGLAWVGVVCTNSMYGWSLDSAGIVGHEVGHNWGSGHCLDTEPCNNMCGACLFIGPNTVDVKRAHMASRTCLDALPASATPLPPYAKIDHVFLNETQLLSGAGFPIDVLDNDHDANCDPILVSTAQSTSAKGGTVSVSPGTGTGGFDQLIYTPPTTGFAGDDRFDYTVSDGTFSTTTRVEVHVQREALAGHWRLDEASGTSAANDGALGGPGNLVGGMDFTTSAVSAIYDGGLQFDGVDDTVEIGALNLNTARASITAWIRRDGTQNDRAGIAFCRGGSTTAGLGFANANDLSYHWDATHWAWSSGLVVPDGQWTFVALVVGPAAGRIYMQPGVTAPMQVAVNVAPHAVEAFEAALILGQDPSTASRIFAGAMDDVRVYSYSLSASEVAQVAAGGRSDAPSPQHLDNAAPRHPVVAWSAGHDAVEHDIYFGPDAAAVAAATPTSPEYRGRHGGASQHPLPLLPPQTTYSWLVDTVLADGTVLPGEPWTFTTAPLRFVAGLEVHYTFDVADLIGNIVLDQAPAPGFPGTLVNGPTFTTGQVGDALDLDGVNDRVEAGSMLLNTNTLTISAWVRRDGPQTGTNGIVFWRGGSTTAALNLGSHHELRYHWDGGNWGWDSGLEIPDGEWCHVALVVEPNRVTIYRNGASAERSATHPPEAFDTALVIGRDPGFGDRYFGGAIDDVAIWSRALSRSEVLTLYAAGSLGRAVQGASDVTPPTPDPLTWDLTPTALGSDTFEMRVSTATDPSSVEYSFVCTSGPGTDSGWQQSPYYADTGLPTGATCTYVATARDVSPNLNVGGSTPAVTVSFAQQFIRGDANVDATVNVADAVAILSYLFNGSVTRCLAANDTNDSESVDIADAVTLLTYLFGTGGSLPAPFPFCGVDPTGGTIPCATYGACP